MKLVEHLNSSIETSKEPVNESLILGAALAGFMLSTAFTGMSGGKDNGGGGFMGAIGVGLGNLLTGIGGMFGGFGLLSSRLTQPSMEPEDLEELLKKDPDDMTGIEKQKLKKLSKDKKYQQNLSNNQIKKLTATVAAIDVADGNDDKTGDETKTDDSIATEYTPEMMAGLMAMAKKANDEEKDKTKKAENEALFDMMSACSYDKDGKEIPMEERLEKMKDMVGEDKWEAFKADITKKFEENKDNEEFQKAMEKAKNTITKEDAEAFVKSAKERAKATLEKVEKEKQEQAQVDKDIADLQAEIDKEKQNSVFKPEENEKLKELVDKLKKRQEDRENLAKNSIAGQAAPAAVNNALDVQKKTEEFENAKKEHNNAAKEIEDLKKSLEGKDKDSEEYKETEKQIKDKENNLADLKKKMDDAEAAKRDAEAKAGSGGGEPGKEPKPKMTENSVPVLDADGDPTGEKIIKTDNGYKKVDKNGNETGDATEEDFNNAKTEFDSYEEDKHSEEDENAGKDLDDTYEEDDNEKNSDEGRSAERDADGKRINPAQKWHKKKKKNGNGTTKNYYDKDGNSISPEEFKNRMNNYKAYVAKHKKGGGTPAPENSSLYTKLRNYLIEKLNN